MVLKLIVVGIDGGALDIVFKHRDVLPSFDHILRYGSYGKMQSTIPPITCPAWPCMFTGLEPEALGMYYFLDNKQHLHDYTEWSDKAVWARLGERGVTVGVYNVPMTYPPVMPFGYIITGMGTPPGAENYVYPTSMRSELPEGYVVNIPVALTVEGRDKEYSHRLLEGLEQKCEVAEMLIMKHPMEGMFLGFFETDPIQHYFWGKDERVIVKAYGKIDLVLKKALETADNVMVVSDHGFTGFRRAFSVNRWLEMKGYLKYVGQPKARVFNPMSAIKDRAVSALHPATVNSIATALPQWLRRKLTTMHEEALRERNLTASIDWDNTCAYSMGISGLIYTTGLCDDEVLGKIVEGIEAEGLRVFRFKRKGHDRPALCIVNQHGICPTALGRDTELWSAPFVPGMHDFYGLYMAWGDKFVKGEVNGMSILDVTPTIMEVFK